MTKSLNGYGYREPKWASWIACMKAGADYLGVRVSDAWLYGATGHAFLLNVHPTVCPSGPTAFDAQPTRELAANAGLKVTTRFAMRSQPDFAERQKAAWEFVRSAIDAGIPCYGWELSIPEYFILTGYDDVGYLYDGFPPSDGTAKPWTELGATDIGMLEAARVEASVPASDARAIKDAAEFALRFASDDCDWVLRDGGYRSGVAAFDVWIAALEERRANPFGLAYNSQVWHECRRHAAGFLQEAADRLRSVRPVCLETADAYEVVAENLSKLTALFSFPPAPDFALTDSAVEAASAHLREAREAEARGLDGLRRLAGQL